MAQGHAAGCSNGPQIGSRTIPPFGSPPRDIMPEGTRVSRNRYERVQRFLGPTNEPWEAMQAFRPSRQEHLICEIVRPPDGVCFRCTCGWEVDEAYLVGLSHGEVRGMLEAHRAGGQVGPQKRTLPSVPIAKQNWTTPEISEPSLTPRRHFKLELDS